jgi:hypothetical protein
MQYPPHDQLEQYRPLIEAALAHNGGQSSWESLVEEVTSGRAFLMVHPSGKSVAVLQPIHALHVWTASGDTKEILEMETEAAIRARNSGFDQMTLRGRKGWERVFKSRGWKPEAGLVKDL